MQDHSLLVCTLNKSFSSFSPAGTIFHPGSDLPRSEEECNAASAFGPQQECAACCGSVTRRGFPK